VLGFAKQNHEFPSAIMGWFGKTQLLRVEARLLRITRAAGELIKLPPPGRADIVISAARLIFDFEHAAR
jgi:hypothetical protein